MTQNTGPVPGAAPAPPPPPPPAAVPPRPPLRRSRTDRVLGGVAGGTAHWLGIDPVVVRVLLVVLAVFGGSGLVLYLLGWLFIPEEGDPESEAQKFANRAGRPGSGARTALIVVAAVVGLIIVSAILGSGPGNGFWGGGSVLLLLAVGALVLYLLNRPPDASAPLPAGPPPGLTPYGPPDPTTTTATAATVAAPTTGPTTGAQGDAQTATASPYDSTSAYDSTSYGTASPYDTTGYAYGGYGGYPGYVTTPPPPLPAPRPRSYLGLATLSLSLVVMGVLGTLAVTGTVSLPAVVVLAAGMGVLGLGLLVGAFAGRARWLIAIALPLLLVTQVASIVPANLRLGGGVGERTWAPTTAATAAGPFRLDVGDAELDLTELVLPPGSTAAYPVRASVGTGNLQVEVPDGMRVQVTATTGLGELTVEGLPRQDGANLRVATLLPDDEPAPEVGPTVDLVVEVGLGNLEVSRA